MHGVIIKINKLQSTVYHKYFVTVPNTLQTLAVHNKTNVPSVSSEASFSRFQDTRMYGDRRTTFTFLLNLKDSAQVWLNRFLLNQNRNWPHAKCMTCIRLQKKKIFYLESPDNIICYRTDFKRNEFLCIIVIFIYNRILEHI